MYLYIFYMIHLQPKQSKENSLFVCVKNIIRIEKRKCAVCIKLEYNRLGIIV